MVNSLLAEACWGTWDEAAHGHAVGQTTDGPKLPAAASWTPGLRAPQAPTPLITPLALASHFAAIQYRDLFAGAGTVQLGAPGEPKLSFDAQGVVSGLTVTTGSAAETLGSFGDGRAAVSRNIVGKGMAVRFGWLPGLSYWCSLPSMGLLER